MNNEQSNCCLNTSTLTGTPPEDGYFWILYDKKQENEKRVRREIAELLKELK